MGYKCGAMVNAGIKPPIAEFRDIRNRFRPENRHNPPQPIRGTGGIRVSEIGRNQDRGTIEARSNGNWAPPKTGASEGFLRSNSIRRSK